MDCLDLLRPSGRPLRHRAAACRSKQRDPSGRYHHFRCDLYCRREAFLSVFEVLELLSGKALMAVVITLSRILTVKRTIMTVPKAYMPVNKEDVPKVGSLSHVFASEAKSAARPLAHR
jgi:hypothetical protein